jgi:hypothetical protein
MGFRTEVAYKLAFVVFCLFLGACDGAGKRLQCTDPTLTSECQRLLSACGADAAAVTPQTVLGPRATAHLAACLQRTYAARCNAACRVAE